MSKAKFGDPDFIDPKEAGRRGGLKRAENREKRKQDREGLLPEERVRQAINNDLEDVVQVLIDAALKRNDFRELDGKTRVDAATKVLYWGIGKPRVEQPKPPEEPKAGEQPGLTVA